MKNELKYILGSARELLVALKQNYGDRGELNIYLFKYVLDPTREILESVHQVF